MPESERAMWERHRAAELVELRAAARNGEQMTERDGIAGQNPAGNPSDAKPVGAVAMQRRLAAERRRADANTWDDTPRCPTCGQRIEGEQ